MESAIVHMLVSWMYRCLFSQTETSLRELLRGGGSDEVIASAWRAALWAKPAGGDIMAEGFRQPDRPMSAIGG